MWWHQLLCSTSGETMPWSLIDQALQGRFSWSTELFRAAVWHEPSSTWEAECTSSKGNLASSVQSKRPCRQSCAESSGFVNKVLNSLVFLDEAMSKRTLSKLNMRRKSNQWKFKNSAHLLRGCCWCPMKLFQKHSLPLPQTSSHPENFPNTWEGINRWWVDRRTWQQGMMSSVGLGGTIKAGDLPQGLQTFAAFVSYQVRYQCSFLLCFIELLSQMC